MCRHIVGHNAKPWSEMHGSLEDTSTYASRLMFWGISAINVAVDIQKLHAS
jgi:hypothetical protein